MIDYNQNSRYYSCDTENDLPQSNFTTYRYSYDTVTVLASEDGRLDLLSYRVYGTPVRWWQIARFNAIINPTSVSVGDKIKVPRL